MFDADAQMNQLAQKFWGDSWENEVKQKEHAHMYQHMNTKMYQEFKAEAAIELHLTCPS